MGPMSHQTAPNNIWTMPEICFKELQTHPSIGHFFKKKKKAKGTILKDNSTAVFLRSGRQMQEIIFFSMREVGLYI